MKTILIDKVIKEIESLQGRINDSTGYRIACNDIMQIIKDNIQDDYKIDYKFEYETLLKAYEELHDFNDKYKDRDKPVNTGEYIKLRNAGYAN